MPTARFGLKAVVLDHEIYAIGGLGKNGALTTVEVYDVNTDSWSKKADLPAPYECTGAAVLDGKIYALLAGDSLWARGSLVEYDPAKDTWTKKADLRSSLYGPGIAVLDGKIYVIGGITNFENGGFKNLDTVEQYDPRTGEWSVKASMNLNRHAMGVAVYNGRIYVFGGAHVDERGIDGPTDAVEEYDPAADKWTMKRKMPFPDACHTVAVLGGRFFIIGGDIGGNTLLEYDPAADTYAYGKSRPAMNWRNCSAALNGKIYVIGGTRVYREPRIPIDSVEVYSPESD